MAVGKGEFARRTALDKQLPEVFVNNTDPADGSKENISSLYPPESWEIARNYSGLLGVVPSSFSSVIRSLMNDEVRNKGELQHGTRFLVERLAKSRSIKACLYFGALTFHADKVEGKAKITDRELVDLYRPAELAGIIGIAYLFRRARKLCDPGQFSSITNHFQMTVDVGTHIGYAIPAISPIVGFLAGGMPYLGLSPFLFYDRKGFIEYAKHLRTKQMLFDYEYELQRWSCTSAQIGSVMMQALGLSVPMAHAYATGVTVKSAKVLDEVPDAYRFSLVAIWINAMMDTLAEPEMVHNAQYYPTQAALARLIENVKEVRDSGSVHCWMIRGSHDVSPESTPALFSSQPPEPRPAGVPVSDEELTKLDTDIEDILGDEEDEPS